LGIPKDSNFTKIPLSLSIPPKGSKEFILWFQTTDTNPRTYLDAKVHLKLVTSVGEITSQLFNVSIAPDSRDMHYKN
jgi:hypothetical protein